jgi:glycosyltransferase involved in cell wall biosynthesis
MLASVLAQTAQDFEVIVVDDGSKDNSLEILQKCSREFPKIKVFTHSNRKNKGISPTANLAIEKSSGEYIAFIGSDDVWYPQILEKQLELIETDAALGIVYAPAHLIDKNGNKLEGTIGKDVTGEKSPVEAIIKKNVIPAITVMMRKAALEKVGVYDEKLVYSDWELWIRILEHYKIGYINVPLSKYRLHNSNTSIGIPVKRHIKFSQAVFRRLLEKESHKEINISPRVIEKGFVEVNRMISVKWMDTFIYLSKKGRLKLALASLKKAFSASPANFLQLRRIMVAIKYFLLGVYKSIFR